MIRVLIERKLAGEGAEGIEAMMREMRSKAIHQPGYVSGETLKNVADPSRFVTLSTWRTRRDWESWYASDARRAVDHRIALLLAEPEQVTIYEPA